MQHPVNEAKVAGAQPRCSHATLRPARPNVLFVNIYRLSLHSLRLVRLHVLDTLISTSLLHRYSGVRQVVHRRTTRVQLPCSDPTATPAPWGNRINRLNVSITVARRLLFARICESALSTCVAHPQSHECQRYRQHSAEARNVLSSRRQKSRIRTHAVQGTAFRY